MTISSEIREDRRQKTEDRGCPFSRHILRPGSGRACGAGTLSAEHKTDNNGVQCTPYQKARRGFTLAEAIMATVVLGIAAAGVLLPFTSGARVRAEGMRRTLAAKLASDLMEEIISIEFDQIVTEYGTYAELQGHIVSDFFTRAEFTDPMYANFSRDASCVNVDVPVSPTKFSEDVEFIRATVRVFYSGKQIATVNQLISE